MKLHFNSCFTQEMSQYANNQNSNKKLSSPGFKKQVESHICAKSLPQVCRSSSKLHLKHVRDIGTLN